MNSLVEAVGPYVEVVQGTRVVDLEHLDILRAERGLSRREAEIAVLENGIMPRRYLRNTGTVGVEGQLALLRSSAAVIGLGGLGGYICEGLARVGVGRLVVADGDVFCDHNLNRQLLSSEGNLGEPKSSVASKRVSQINRAIEVVCHPYRATRGNLPKLLSDVDVVVDALDRLPSRLVLQEAAAQAGVPMVHGAIAGWMGQVMTILPGDAGLRALYGDGPVPEQGAEVGLGTPPASPMMVAAWQVHEAIKVILGVGELLRSRMLLLDALVGEIRVIELPDQI
jgi:molybdopterin/thiamine biosynthesis adenylyltransferase